MYSFLSVLLFNSRFSNVIVCLRIVDVIGFQMWLLLALVVIILLIIIIVPLVQHFKN